GHKAGGLWKRIALGLDLPNPLVVGVHHVDIAAIGDHAFRIIVGGGGVGPVGRTLLAGARKIADLPPADFADRVVDRVGDINIARAVYGQLNRQAEGGIALSDGSVGGARGAGGARQGGNIAAGDHADFPVLAVGDVEVAGAV